MARIQSRSVAGSIRVNLSGRLRAADMGRLEHACREALTHQPLQLVLDLSRVTEIDQTAAAVVERLRRRGAQVRRSAGEHADHQPAANDVQATTNGRITRSG